MAIFASIVPSGGDPVMRVTFTDHAGRDSENLRG
jgi:hypothetical protein